jgi:ethanolamine permease
MAHLQRTLGPVMLWGMGVGYVISGMYFGWNLGLPLAGPYGMLAATAIVTWLYVAFVLSYAELACAMPHAGGAFVYANEAFGPRLGYLGGVAQCIEFVFAPPAIAVAVGAYFHLFLPSVPVTAIALAAYAIFTALNIWGVRQSAIFELAITALAVAELLLFAGLTLPSFSWAEFSRDALPGGWAGIFPALPYAIWFYLAIEGVANVAEETIDPKRQLLRGFLSSIGTLVALAFLTLFASVGVAGWRAVVLRDGSADPSDSPLPLALAKVVGEGHAFYHLLVGIGLCGLLASFHGIILCAGRATFEFGRVGYAPKALGRVLERRRTPAVALLANMAIGSAAILTGRTGDIITLSVLGALVLYVVSLLAVFRLRRDRPEMERPFRAPGYPWIPASALAIALVCLASMAISNPRVTAVFAALVAVAYAWYAVAVPHEAKRAVSRAGGAGLRSVS